MQTWVNNTANSYIQSGIISGISANNLTIGGTGNFAFTAGNTYSGGTSLFTGSLTLSGAAGAVASTSGVALGAGTILSLDNTSANHASQNRIGDSTTITSSGGFINLLGNSAANTTETTGTLAVASGATYVTVTPGGAQTATLTLGAAGTIASLSHTMGGTVTFSSTGTVMAPNVTLVNTSIPANAIIGGWATVGGVSSTTSNTFNFATVSGGQIVPLAAYQALTSAPLSTDNAQGTAATDTVTLASSKTVNTLSFSGSAYGLKFTAATDVLTIGAGGIFSNNATGTGHFDNKANITNMSFVGSADSGTNNIGGTVAYTGRITSGFFPTATTSELDVSTTASGNLRLYSVIQDPDATHKLTLVKSGPGLLDLSGGNTQNNKTAQLFTGKVVINEGILLINSANNLGAGVAAPDAVTFNGGELRTFAGINPTDSTKGWTVGTRGGAFSYTGGGTSSINNKITGVGGFTFYARDNGGGGGETIQLNNTTGGAAHDYQGATTFWQSLRDDGVNFGTLRFQAANQLPSTSAVIANLVNDTPAHNILANTQNVGVDLNGTNQSFGSLNGNLNFRNFNTGATLTLGGNNLSTTYTGALLGTGGILTKVGSGTQTLSGVNTYTGATNINGGTLLIGTGTGTTGAGSLANTAVSVGNGTLTGALGGNGTVNGLVTVTATGHLAPAMTASTTNTLTLTNGLTMNIAGGTLDYNFGTLGTGGNGVSDLVSVTGGNVSLAGAQFLNVTQLTGFGIGTYKLITTGAGTFTDTATFTINGKANFNYFVLKGGDAIDATAGGGTVTAKQLWLEVLQGNPLLTWKGQTDGNWNTSTNNWAGDATVFTTGANVTFDDVGIATPRTGVTVVGGGVTANSMAVANASGTYTIGGGAITITSGTGLVKTQGGSITFNNSVTTPTTTISAGTVTAGAGGALNSTGKIDVNNGGTLNVTGGSVVTPTLNVKSGATLGVSSGSLGSATTLNLDGATTFGLASQTLSGLNDFAGGATTGVLTLTGTALTVGTGAYDGTISGTGSLTKNTAGTLLLTNTGNGFSGSVTVLNGTLGVAGLGALGTGVTPITLGDVATSGTLQYSGSNATFNRGVTLAAGGGGLEVTAPGVVLTLSGPVTNGSSTLTLLGAGNGNITGVLAGPGNVIKQGAGEWTLSNTTAAPGATAGTVFNIQSGTLTGVSNGTISSLGGAAITLAGSTLGLSASAAATFDNAVSVTQNSAITAFQSALGGGAANQLITLGSATNGIAVAATKTVTLASANGDTLTTAGNITGAGGVTFNGGIVNVSGATNGYAGATVITAGAVTATTALNGTASVTGNGGTFTTNAALTTPGAITLNNNAVLTGGAAVNAASMQLNGTSTFNGNGPTAVTGAIAVSGGTFNANATGSVTANSLTVSGGTYNGNSALISTNGLAVSAGLAHIVAPGGASAGPLSTTGTGTLQFDAGTGNTVTYAGSSVSNNSLLQVKTGTADLGNTVITTTNGSSTAGTANRLAVRYFRPADVGAGDFLGTNGDPYITFENTGAFHTRTPGAAGTLGNADLTFTGANLQTQANAIVPNFYGITDNEGVAWVGRLTVGGANLPAGAITFGTNSDDGSTLYIDANLDGVFQASERVVNNIGPHGNVNINNTITLAAGTYNIAIGYYNGNGGAQIDAKFAAGSAVPFATQALINPGAGTQAGIFATPTTPGSTIRVDAGATLSAGGFTADAVVLLGSNTNAATLVLKNNGALVNSAANSLALGGTANSLGTVNLGTNNTVTVGTASVGAGDTLTKAGVGRLVISGTHTLQTGASLDASGGTLELAATATGAGPGLLTASGTGTLLINGTENGGVTINSGGTLLAGTGTINGLVTGNSGAHFVTHTAPTTTGALNLGGGLTLNSGVNLDFNFGTAGSPGTSDVINVAGTFTLLGTSTLNINALAGFGVGTYRLLTFVNPLGGGGAITIGSSNAPLTNGYSIVYLPNEIDLQVGVLTESKIFTGNAATGAWDIATSSNWKTNSIPVTNYANGDSVVFDTANNPSLITAITVTAGGVNPLSVNIAGDTLNYSFSGGSINGATGIAKSGLSTASLTVANGLTGLVTVQGGILNASHNAALGNSGGVTVSSGAAFQLQGGITTSNAIPLTLNGTGVAALPAGALDSVSGVNAYTGTVNLATASTVGVDADSLTLSGVISGGNLTKRGTGTLVFSNNANSYGNTTVAGGVLSVSSDGNLGAVPGAVTPASLTLNGGTLQFNATTVLATNRGITVGAAGGTFNIPFTAGGTIDPAASTGVKYSGVITGSGNVTFKGGAGVNDPVAAPYLFVLDSAANNYGGSTLIDNATVTNDAGLTGGNMLPASTVLTLNNHGVYAYWGGTATQTLAGLVGDSTGLIGTENNSSASSLTINTGAVTSYTYGGQIGDVNVLGRGHTLTGGAPFALVKNGAGTQSLTGVNPYTNGTTINGGILNVNADAALGTAAGAVAINNGATLQASGPVTTAARTITLGTGGGKIDTNGNAVNLNAGSTVTGTSLTKIGNGTLTIGGTQTYATFNANAGTTVLNSALGTGTSTLNANATVNITASQTLAALNIADGVEVTFGDGLPFSPASEKFGTGVVPEPGSSVLLLGGLATLGLRRRRTL